MNTHLLNINKHYEFSPFIYYGSKVSMDACMLSTVEEDHLELTIIDFEALKGSWRDSKALYTCRKVVENQTSHPRG